MDFPFWSGPDSVLPRPDPILGGWGSRGDADGRLMTGVPVIAEVRLKGGPGSGQGFSRADWQVHIG